MMRSRRIQFLWLAIFFYAVVFSGYVFASIATLTDSANPLTLTYLRHDTTVNNRNYVYLFNAGTATSTTTSISPAGRKVTSTLDAKGRLTQRAITGLTPIDFTYDQSGHLAAIGQGARKTSIAYNALNEVLSVTDSLGRSAAFGYDLVGRVTNKTLADGRVINYMYDANGNLAGITPPSRPVHAFTYSVVDLNDSYIPPSLGVGAGAGAGAGGGIAAGANTNASADSPL